MRPILILILAIVIIFDLALNIFSATRHDSKRSIYFSVLSMALLFYSTGYLFEVMCRTQEAALVAVKIENFGIPLISPFFLFACISLFHPKHLKKWMLPAGLVYGMLMFGIVASNDYHNLYYSSITMMPGKGDYFYVSFGRGPIFFVQQTIGVLLFALSYAILLSRFIKGGKQLRSKMIYIVIGSMLTLFADFLHLAEMLPDGLDATPIALTGGLLLFSINIFKDKIMDVVTLSCTMEVDTMDDSMIVFGSDWSYLFCNRKAKQLFPELAGFSGYETMYGRNWWPPELFPRSEAGQETFKRFNPQTNNISTYRANISKIAPDKNSDMGWSIVIRDITDMTSLLDKLEELATVDSLTGILNRRQFLSTVNGELDRAVRHSQDTGLIMYDLDLFKKVNDTYGHVAGDRVLCGVVDVIKKQLRAYDIFGRYGGEEFVIFTVNVNSEDLFLFASRLCKAVEAAEIVYDNIRIPITASFGAVRIPPGASFDSAMLAVDEALYKAKSGGRNMVVLGEIPPA